MSTSADSAPLRAPARRTSRVRRAARRPAQAGFTPLEIMATLAIVGLLIVPILQEREVSSNMAFRSGRMANALNHARQLLADRTLDPDPVRGLHGVVESDPQYRWELTIEEFDLSTGRVVEATDPVTGEPTTTFSTTSAFNLPGDAGAPPDASEQESPHRVRRYKLRMLYPSYQADQEGELLLEGFLPRVAQQPSLLPTPN